MSNGKGNNSWEFATRAVRAGYEPEETTGAIIPPIFATSTYKQESPGIHKGFDYGRSHNPTRYAYEGCVANLEGGHRGFAFSSGLAAAATVLDALPAGSHIIAVDDLYGGTFRLFERVRKISAGLEVTYLPLEQQADFSAHIRPNTKLVWVETPTNPLLKLIDLQGIATAARKAKLISVADNTFASPFCQRPLECGFDLVLHSATKYLNGHCDVIGGIVVTREPGELTDTIAFIQNAVGSIPSPFDCFLIHRGIKTLPVRMARQTENALEIAQWLEGQKKVAKVIYPGLPSHPQHELARRQMYATGGMVSIVVKGDLESVRRMLGGLEVLTVAESLGGVESLVDHPAIMTHASIPPERRREIGIDDGLIRLSIGIENIEDLKRDLETALTRL